MLRPASVALVLALSLGAAHATAQAAQDGSLLPPGMVGSDRQLSDVQPAPGPTYTMAQNDGGLGELLVRIQRLEGQNRALNGTVEDLQGQVRKLQDDIKRQQDDTEYRLQALEGGKGGAAPAPKASAAPPQKKSGNAGAPPRTLGSLPSNDQGGDDQGGQQAMQDQGGDQPDQPVAPRPRARTNSSPVSPGLDGVAVDTSQPPASNDSGAGTAPASAQPQTPDQEYTTDYRLIQAQQYTQAEAAFRNFVAAYPKDKHVPDAIHWIGESLYQRKQYTDAAEQFAKVTKTYGKSARAPSSMLKLGMALAALGEKDAACATLQAVAVKYPKAGPTIISGADREIKKNACPAG